MSDEILRIENLSKTYHTKEKEVLTLQDISFSVNNKEYVSIVGPSGCGKSTILGIVADIISPSKGLIKFNKKDPVIGYMFQKDALLEWKNVLDNCLIGLKIKNNLTENNKEKVKSLLIKYGLKDFIYSYPYSLSGGMRQRVALIRTLAIDPDILLLDEPFSALDYQTRLTLSDELYNIIKTEGKTAIMVTHDIAEAISMSDKIILLSKRPAIIKNIYDLILENKQTPMENRKDKNFIKYYNLIWNEIDSHV